MTHAAPILFQNDTDGDQAPGTEIAASERFAWPVQFAGCAGIFHPARGSRGVIFLNSFGYEALASHKCFRLLAEQCARAGFPVLRFDFLGTGDSKGDESDWNLVQTRSESVVQACRFMRESLGIETIVLVGFRLGASIAALAAASCQVEELILIEPVVSGRTWLREQDVLPQLAGLAPQAHGKSSGRQAGSSREYMGYIMSADSCRAVADINLRQVPLPAGSRCQVLAGDHGRALADTVSQWRDGSVSVATAPFDAFPSLMMDPAIATPPEDFFGSIITWLGDAGEHGSFPARSDHQYLLKAERWQERAVYFGAPARRFGVLCEPVDALPDAPVLIVVNTGGNPHTGIGRQNVEMARNLACAGFASFRIDINGTGETPDIAGRPAQLVYTPDSSADVVAAMDWLKSDGRNKIALVGICSGAYLAYQTSLRDERIAAMLLINLQKFEWRAGDRLVLYRSAASYFSSLFQRETWRRIFAREIDLSGIAGSIIQKLAARCRATVTNIFSRLFKQVKPVQLTPLHQMQRHLDEGKIIHLVYTQDDGGIDEAEIYLGRRGRLLSAYDNFDMQLISDADHNFANAADRVKLIKAVREFAIRSFARPVPAQIGVDTPPS